MVATQLATTATEVATLTPLPTVATTTLTPTLPAVTPPPQPPALAIPPTAPADGNWLSRSLSLRFSEGRLSRYFTIQYDRY